MKTCFLAVGGAGAKAARALVYCALAGVIPAETVEVILADTDQRDEETPALYARYAQVKPLLPENRPSMRCRRWPEGQLENGSLNDAAQTPEDQLLLRALLPGRGEGFNGTEGFQGQADVAALVLTGLLGGGNAHPEGALEECLEALEGEACRVVLCGSAMGGVGAAGLTVLTPYLRERLPKAHIAAVALLPYFRAAEEQSTQAAAALKQWGADGLCDAVYLLGLEQSAYATAPEGCREARLPEWLAALCCADAFQTDRQGCFTWRVPMGPLDWTAFGTSGERYRQAFGRLTQMAASLRLEMGETIRRGLAEPRWLRDRLIPWYAGCFGTVRRLPQEKRQVMAEQLKELTALLASYEGWMGEVIATLPPQLRTGSAMDEAVRQAEENYQQLARTAAQLAVMRAEAEADEWRQQTVQRGQSSAEEDEARQALARTEASLRQLEEKQRACLECTGGRVYLTMLRALARDFRQEADRFRGQTQEAQAHIRRAEAEGSPETLGRIAVARAKLQRMERSLLLLDARRERAEADLRAAEAREIREIPPKLPETGKPAECGLFAPAIGAARDQRQLERAWHEALPGPEGEELTRRRENLARMEAGDEPLRDFVRAMLKETEDKA